MLNWRREFNCYLYAVPFKHFEDFSAADTLAVAQEVAEVGYRCLQGVKPCRPFGDGTQPRVVAAESRWFDRSNISSGLVTIRELSRTA